MFSHFHVQVRFHVPYKNIRMGGYATAYKAGYWNGKWIEADTKVEPPSGMKTFWGKKSSTDGMGQCSVVQGSWLGYARMTDHMCHTKVRLSLLPRITGHVDKIIRRSPTAKRSTPSSPTSMTLATLSLLMVIWMIMRRRPWSRPLLSKRRQRPSHLNC